MPLPPTVLQNVAVRASSRDFSPGPVPNASARAGAAPGGHRTASAEAAALQVAPWPASPIQANPHFKDFVPLVIRHD